jgi:hypothetical protein
MSKSINESKLTIQLEVVTELWIRAHRRPHDFYLEFAELLKKFDQVYIRSYDYFGYINAWCNWLEQNDIRGLKLNELVEELKRKAFVEYQRYFKSYQSEHRSALRRHRENETRNIRSLERKARSAVERYAKTEVVRIDLGYIKKYQHLVNIADFYDDMKELRAQMSKREKPFNALIDFGWALEQGVDKGYHCHLVLFFNGHIKQDGWGIAHQVGKEWQKITGKLGYFFNCHDPEQIQEYSELDILGIGRIHRNNSTEVEKMVNAIRYLVRPEKDAQHLRVKLNSKMRTFQ